MTVQNGHSFSKAGLCINTHCYSCPGKLTEPCVCVYVFHFGVLFNKGTTVVLVLPAGTVIIVVEDV